MKFKSIFKDYWILLLTSLVLFFWLGFFITENIYNQSSTTYTIEIESNVFTVEEITADFFLDALRKVDEEGNVSYSYETVKPAEFFSKNDITLTSDSDTIILTVKAKYFIGSEEVTISIKSLDRFMKVMKKVVSFYDKDAVINSCNVKEFSDSSLVIINNYIEPYEVSIITLGSGFLLCIILIYLFRNKIKVSKDEIYESGNIFKTPFSKKYWVKAVNSFRKIKIFDMCFISILFALQIIAKNFSIPSGFANLEIGITYLVFSYICLIYGPIWGLVIGFSSDILGFIMNPTIFHPGYTLQAMLTGFVYGLCFYRTDLKFSKVLISRIIVNILLNGIFGAFLWGSYAGLDFEATITYMNVISLPKNIIFLIPQALLLYFFLKVAVPLLTRKNFVPEETIK